MRLAGTQTERLTEGEAVGRKEVGNFQNLERNVPKISDPGAKCISFVIFDSNPPPPPL